jgi:hypothetical protein
MSMARIEIYPIDAAGTPRVAAEIFNEAVCLAVKSLEIPIAFAKKKT